MLVSVNVQMLIRKTGAIAPIRGFSVGGAGDKVDASWQSVRGRRVSVILFLFTVL
jgi:hypothetical protein